MFKITAEQACRFRTQSGYRVCAKSGGFTDTNAQHMEDEFNDSMNPLFNGSIGKSCLACVSTGEDTFLALCTLRTDMHGRPAIFTNAAVIPTDTYRQKIAEDPAGIIFTPLDQLINHMPSSPMLPGVEMGGTEVPDLAQLRQKYNLTDERYAELLCGAYRALTSMKCLCFRTGKNVEEIRTIRELCYCIAMGAPASMRGRISFCSAGDLRKNLCLSTPRNGMVSGDEITFDLDAAAPAEEMSRLDQVMYMTLAQLPETERAQLLARMDNWLNSLLGGSKDYPADLAVLAFYHEQPTAMEPELARKLIFLTMDAVKVVECNADVLDEALVQLLKLMDTLPAESREALVGRMSSSHNEVFRQLMMNLVSECSASEQAAMLEKAMNGELGAQSHEIALVLLDKIPVNSSLMTPQLQDRVIRVALSGEFAEMQDYAYKLVDYQSLAERTQLAERILCSFEDGRGGLHQPRTEEWQMLLYIFDMQIRDAFAKGEEAGRHLLGNDQMLALSEKANNIWQAFAENAEDLQSLQNGIYYSLLTHYAARNLKDSVREINDLVKKQPHYEAALVETAKQRLPDYYAAVCLQCDIMRVTTTEELVEICGAQSRIIREMPQQLEDEVVAKFAALYSKRTHQTGADWIVPRVIEEGEKLKNTTLSDRVQARILAQEMNWSLKQISYQDLLNSRDAVAKVWNLASNLKDASLLVNPKVKFAKAYHEMVAQRMDREFVALVRGRELGLTAAERRTLSDQIPQMMKELAAHRQPFSWELFFLYCLDDSGNDWDQFAICELMDTVQETRRANPADLYSNCPMWVTPDDCRILYKNLKEGGTRTNPNEKEIIRVLKDLSKGKNVVPRVEPARRPGRDDEESFEMDIEVPAETAPKRSTPAQTEGLKKPAQYQEERFDAWQGQASRKTGNAGQTQGRYEPAAKPEPKKKGGLFGNIFGKK